MEACVCVCACNTGDLLLKLYISKCLTRVFDTPSDVALNLGTESDSI